MRTKEIISQTLAKKISTIIYFFATLILTATFQVLCILIIRTLIDTVFSVPVVEGQEGPKLAFWIGSFAVSLLLMLIMGILNKSLSLAISSNVSTALRKAAYSSCLRADINEIEKLDNKEMVTRIFNDSNYIGDIYLGKNWFRFFRNIVFILAYFISMMIISPILGLITFGALPIFYMLVRSYDKYFMRVSVKAEANYQIIKSSIVDDLENIRSIKLRNGIVQEEEKLTKLNEKFVATTRSHGAFKDIKENKLFDLLVGLLFTLLLGVGGYLSTRNKAIPGTIMAIILMTPVIYSMFRQLMYNSIYTSVIENQINSLESIITVKSEFRAEPITSLDEIHTFTFENLTYSKDGKGFENVSFDLKRGEKLGILSLEKDNNKILFELLTKLIRPKEGTISINNCDINKINTLYLRNLITAIPEEKSLFSDTIENNIIYPHSFDEYKYNDALNKSGLKHYLADLEDKDQTIISEANPLSKELQERIIYANAFYKDSKIFVINDAVSSLDARSEEIILQEVFELKNKIIILITDKNYNLLSCDKILILDGKEVIEYGEVDELVKNKQSILYKIIKKVKITKSAKVS